MAHKVNRNEPCPCGSGKKYKKCCLLEVRKLSGIRASNREVVQEAVRWLSMQHGDALARWVEDVWFAGISDDERKGISTADPAIQSIHDANVLEQMLAEGVFQQDEQSVQVLQLVLDSAMDLEVGQREYLEQLGRNPLCLYSVTRSEPGVGFALQRYPLTEGAEEVYIEDKWVSRMLERGDVVGMRLMQTLGLWENSGAVYHIPEEYVAALQSELESSDACEQSRVLIHYWLGLVAAHV